ncbi:hypothetical protein BDP27DRAFT_1231430 [Rhodocollybia butyracea]|uniref:Protein HRI1 n=1 Tax=Rhodocollybia butyracea TaxID=206335 RepID=A0A9P5PDT7_9AGAR|nr:hypothetical protein BDP27DRAFT_1231430 [Rhodocollybia butyracea]
MTSTISIRESIRWIPEEGGEPTDTVVLIGGISSIFLDVRFLKESNVLDWGIAGYRSNGNKNVTKFTHSIDSRDSSEEVVDYGYNTELPDGTILEKGEMVNPATGKMTAYEEVWRDEHPTDNKTLLLRNLAQTSWYGHVGGWQLALGRDSRGVFWAIQARMVDRKWEVIHATRSGVTLLPEDTSKWVEGSEVEWNGDQWLVLEKEPVKEQVVHKMIRHTIFKCHYAVQIKDLYVLSVRIVSGS